MDWIGSPYYDGTMGVLPGTTGENALSLDKRNQNCTHAFYHGCPECVRRKRRRNRCFQRVMSGMRLGGNLKMLTLTTSREAFDAGKDIQRSFRALVMRLRRRNLCTGYVRVVEFTRAGLPHYHVIVRGGYIPQWWLSRVWAEIHLSPVVDVRAVRGRAGGAAYLAKYLGKDARSRYSWGWDWVWRGFARDWRALCSDGYERGASMLDIVSVWEGILDAYRLRRAAEH